MSSEIDVVTKDFQDRLDFQLRSTVRKSLGDDRHVDAWMGRMIQNCRDAATEEDASDALPVRRIGLHSRNQ